MDNIGIALAIAKTRLVADLKRHGVQDTEVLVQAIMAATRRCSRENVRQARQCLLSIMDKCSERLCIYLTSLSMASSNRRAVNVLYIIHDTLAWDRRHATSYTQFIESLTLHLQELLQAAKGSRCDYLIEIWKKQKFFGQEVLEAARKPLRRMPTYLGKPNTPYYELPAATMIPHINGDHQSIPFRDVKPVKLAGMSKELSTALDETYKRMDKGWQFTEENEEQQMHYNGWSPQFVARLHEK